MVHSWAVGSLLAETIRVADVYLHHHTNVLSYSASVSSGRLLLISNPSNHSMFWCLQAVENNQMECTAKIEIHGSTVGYWLHFIPNSLFRSVTHTGQHASKCYQKDAFKGVETCITPQLQVSPQWLTQMVYKTSSPPCLLVSMSLRIWGKVHMGGGGSVIYCLVLTGCKKCVKRFNLMTPNCYCFVPCNPVLQENDSKYWYKLQYRAHDVIREPMANQN